MDNGTETEAWSPGDERESRHLKPIITIKSYEGENSDNTSIAAGKAATDPIQSRETSKKLQMLR